MIRMESVVITGLGLEIPGIPDATSFPRFLAAPIQPGEFTPADKLGRGGLRYKDRATKLALCAAQSALVNAGLPTSASEQISPETFGVVVSSNLGNLDTVCRVVETIRARGADDTSPLDMPNLSSNVVASSIAIRFGCKALNVMVCNGSTSGSDALYIAANAIRARRARRMLVVGVEPSNPVVARLMEESALAWLRTSDGIRIGDGGGAVILEAADAAAERGAQVSARLGGFGFACGADVKLSILGATSNEEAPPDLWLTPNCSYALTAAAVDEALGLWREAPPICLDLSIALGETYGALGVLQCIAACLWLKSNDSGRAVATSGASWGDGSSSLLIFGADLDRIRP